MSEPPHGAAVNERTPAAPGWTDVNESDPGITSSSSSPGWRSVWRCFGGWCSPTGVGRLETLDLVPVVPVVDHLAVRVEAEHRDAGQCQLLTPLDPAGPPLDRSSVVRDDRIAEAALDLVLDREVRIEVAPDAIGPAIGLAKRERAVHDRVCVQREDRVDVPLRPRLRPHGRPVSSGVRGVHIRIVGEPRRGGTRGSPRAPLAYRPARPP